MCRHGNWIWWWWWVGRAQEWALSLNYMKQSVEVSLAIGFEFQKFRMISTKCEYEIHSDENFTFRTFHPSLRVNSND